MSFWREDEGVSGHQKRFRFSNSVKPNDSYVEKTGITENREKNKKENGQESLNIKPSYEWLFVFYEHEGSMSPWGFSDIF